MLLNKIQTKLRNRVDETTSRTLYSTHTSKGTSFYYYKTMGDENHDERETLLHVIKCELETTQMKSCSLQLYHSSYIIYAEIELMYKKHRLLYCLFWYGVYVFWFF